MEHKAKIVKALKGLGFNKTKIRYILKGVRYIKRSRWGLSRLDLTNCNEESKKILEQYVYYDDINKEFVKKEEKNE